MDLDSDLKRVFLRLRMGQLDYINDYQQHKIQTLCCTKDLTNAVFA